MKQGVFVNLAKVDLLYSSHALKRRGLFETENKMTPKEADRLLKIGDRVQIWAESPDACTGTITEKNWCAAKIEWDDGQVGVIHLDDMKNVTKHYGPSIVPTNVKTA